MEKRNKLQESNQDEQKDGVGTVVLDDDNKTAEIILKGIENKEFKMYLQFVVDNKSKKIVSAEALSRWDKPEEGILAPGKYIGHMKHPVLSVSMIFICLTLHVSSLKNGRTQSTRTL